MVQKTLAVSEKRNKFLSVIEDSLSLTGIRKNIKTFNRDVIPVHYSHAENLTSKRAPA